MRDFIARGFVKSFEAGDADLAAINRLAIEPLTLDDVYVFELEACDTEIDRANERFDRSAIDQMAERYIGKTVIKDHMRRSDNQFARVYDAYGEDGTSSKGEPVRKLILRCYTRDCEANKEMIADIKAGIKKEVSVSFLPGSYTCSICGRDNKSDGMCRHWPGREYDGEKCHFTFSDIQDVYEVSFVAVPCQPDAATRKDFGDGGPEDADEHPDGKPHKKALDGADQIEEEAPGAGAFFMERAIALAEAELTLAKGKR
jgi:hypothetical protein